MFSLNRRNFIQSAFAGAACGLGGCRSLVLGERPELRFGVVSDIHVTTPESVALFEASLRYFRDRDVDAVMVPGDLTDWGLKSSLQYIADAWNRVFPPETPGGRSRVVPLFCTGNHDFDGWAYGDMTMEMHANGYSEDEALSKLGLKTCWEEIFHEPWEPIRVRTVKGYDFISGEYRGAGNFAEWMKANGARFKGDKPFFYFQHLPLTGTTADAGSWADKGVGLSALKDFPNAVSFTGHTHHTFNDERAIWQGSFTAVATPSLSYMTVPSGHENGSGKRNGTGTETMPKIPARRDLRGGQGFVVSVYRDRMEIERRDLEEGGVEGASPWIVPLPMAAGSKPYSPDARAKLAQQAPQFPAGAKVETYTRNTETRQGKWAIAMTLRFPAAIPPKGQRILDYEVRAVPKDGSAPLVKRFVSPAFHKLEKYEPKTLEFWFNVDELPQDKPYVLEVYPRNWFGTCGRPIVSRTWHGKPGLDKAKR